MQFRPAVLCAGLALSISTPVAAGTLTFSPNQSLIDGSGTWSTANSEWWTGTTHRAWINPATGSPDTAIFGWGLAQAGTVTVQGPVRVLDLTFNQVLGSYTLSGGTLSTDLAGSARAAIWTMNDDAFVSSTVIGVNWRAISRFLRRISRESMPLTVVVTGRLMA